jgi:hypothetical protein
MRMSKRSKTEIPDERAPLFPSRALDPAPGTWSSSCPSKPTTSELSHPMFHSSIKGGIVALTYLDRG